jgi:hypothetical protein
MKRMLISALVLTTTMASAECYLRMSTNLTKSAVEGIPTDLQRLVSTEKGQSKCVLRYRLFIDNEWQTVEGTGYATTEDQACARAADRKRGSILGEVVREKVKANQEMICSDLPEIRVRPVWVGEIIWESETDMHRHPMERAYFNYKDTRCRMFTERNAKDGNMYTYQGIICRENAQAYSKWRVIDKY